MNNKRADDAAFDLVIKRLPAPIRSILAIFNIGVVEKRPETISYKSLKKSISLNHPVDPLTGWKFSVSESVTVASYNLKLADAFGCIKLYNLLGRYKAKFVSVITNKKVKDITKPESMKDVPDDDADDSFKGLSKAAIYVGEGPILYL
jgi:hypothetical protein